MENRIKELRQKYGISYRELDKMAGMDHSAIYRVENNIRTGNSITYERIANALNVDMNCIFGKPNAKVFVYVRIGGRLYEEWITEQEADLFEAREELEINISDKEVIRYIKGKSAKELFDRRINGGNLSEDAYKIAKYYDKLETKQSKILLMSTAENLLKIERKERDQNNE